jgi:hypothetical protein
MNHKRKHIAQRAWNDADRQAFADGNRTRATTIPNKRRAADKRACRDRSAW